MISRTSTNRTTLQKLCDYKIIQENMKNNIRSTFISRGSPCLHHSCNKKQIYKAKCKYFNLNHGHVATDHKSLHAFRFDRQTIETSTIFVQGATHWCMTKKECKKTKTWDHPKGFPPAWKLFGVTAADNLLPLSCWSEFEKPKAVPSAVKFPNPWCLHIQL